MKSLTRAIKIAINEANRQIRIEKDKSKVSKTSIVKYIF